MTDQPPPAAGAVRLIFEYDGDTVRLVSQEPVDIVAPPAPAERAGRALRGDPQRRRRPCSRGAGPHRASTRVPRSSPRTTRSRSPASTPRRGAPSPSSCRRRRRRRAQSAVVRAAGPDRGGPAGPGPPGAGDLELGSFPLDGAVTAMTTSDGTVLGATQIFGVAPRNRAFNVVLLADGFTAAQQTSSTPPAPRSSRRCTPPRRSTSCARRSTSSGSTSRPPTPAPTIPSAGGGTGATARTYFDATFGGNSIRRLLVCNDTTALHGGRGAGPGVHGRDRRGQLDRSTAAAAGRSAPTRSPAARPRSRSTRWATPRSGWPTSTRTTPAAPRPATTTTRRASRPSRTSPSTPTGPR